MKNSETNMDFRIEFTEECIEEMSEIYEYISYNLKANTAAKRLMTEVANRILDLSISPESYVKIKKIDKLKREYHKIVVKNYIILYSIDFEKHKIYISHMIYGRRNYLNLN